MRIIAGSLKGRNIEAPKGHKTHPMSEKMRGALFNVLDDIKGYSVFDAYGGTGALAIEAISRGAKSALITEVDMSAHATINQNIKRLRLDNQVESIKANTATWSQKNLDTKFDLVICDPPYQKINLAQLQQITMNTSKGGIFVLSTPAKYLAPEFKNLELIKSSDYGDGSLAFYRKI